MYKVIGQLSYARDAIVKMNVKSFLLFTEMIPLICFIKVFDVSKNELHRLNYINLTKKSRLCKEIFNTRGKCQNYFCAICLS